MAYRGKSLKIYLALLTVLFLSCVFTSSASTDVKIITDNEIYTHPNQQEVIINLTADKDVENIIAFVELTKDADARIKEIVEIIEPDEINETNITEIALDKQNKVYFNNETTSDSEYDVSETSLMEITDNFNDDENDDGNYDSAKRELELKAAIPIDNLQKGDIKQLKVVLEHKENYHGNIELSAEDENGNPVAETKELSIRPQKLFALKPSVDTYVDKDYPTKSFSDKKYLKSDDDKISLIKFDLRNYTIDHIRSSSLYLYPKEVSFEEIEVYYLDGDWDENVSYETLPEIGAFLNSTLNNETGYFQVHITEIVNETYYSGDRVLSLAVRTENPVSFMSSENKTHSPILYIDDPIDCVNYTTEDSDNVYLTGNVTCNFLTSTKNIVIYDAEIHGEGEDATALTPSDPGQPGQISFISIGNITVTNSTLYGFGGRGLRIATGCRDDCAEGGPGSIYFNAFDTLLIENSSTIGYGGPGQRSSCQEFGEGGKSQGYFLGSDVIINNTRINNIGGGGMNNSCSKGYGGRGGEGFVNLTAIDNLLIFNSVIGAQGGRGGNGLYSGYGGHGNIKIGTNNKAVIDNSFFYSNGGFSGNGGDACYRAGSGRFNVYGNKIVIDDSLVYSYGASTCSADVFIGEAGLGRISFNTLYSTINNVKFYGYGGSGGSSTRSAGGSPGSGWFNYQGLNLSIRDTFIDVHGGRGGKSEDPQGPAGEDANFSINCSEAINVFNLTLNARGGLGGDSHYSKGGSGGDSLCKIFGDRVFFNESSLDCIGGAANDVGCKNCRGNPGGHGNFIVNTTNSFDFFGKSYVNAQGGIGGEGWRGITGRGGDGRIEINSPIVRFGDIRDPLLISSGGLSPASRPEREGRKGDSNFIINAGHEVTFYRIVQIDSELYPGTNSINLINFSSQRPKLGLFNTSMPDLFLVGSPAKIAVGRYDRYDQNINFSQLDYYEVSKEVYEYIVESIVNITPTGSLVECNDIEIIVQVTDTSFIKRNFSLFNDINFNGEIDANDTLVGINEIQLEPNIIKNATFTWSDNTGTCGIIEGNLIARDELINFTKTKFVSLNKTQELSQEDFDVLIDVQTTGITKNFTIINNGMQTLDNVTKTFNSTKINNSWVGFIPETNNDIIDAEDFDITVNLPNSASPDIYEGVISVSGQDEKGYDYLSSSSNFSFTLDNSFTGAFLIGNDVTDFGSVVEGATSTKLVTLFNNYNENIISISADYGDCVDGENISTAALSEVVNTPIYYGNQEDGNFTVNLPLGESLGNYMCIANITAIFGNGLELTNTIAFTFSVEKASDYVSITEYHDLGEIPQGDLREFDSEIINNYISDIQSLEVIQESCYDSPSFLPDLSHGFNLPLQASTTVSDSLVMPVSIDAEQGMYNCSALVKMNFENGAEVNKSFIFVFEVLEAQEYVNMTEEYDFGIGVQGENKQASSEINNAYISDLVSLDIVSESCQDPMLNFVPDLTNDFTLPVISSNSENGNLIFDISLDATPGSYNCSAEAELVFQNSLEMIKNISFIFTVDNAENYINITEYYDFSSIVQGDNKELFSEITNNYISDINSLDILSGLCEGSSVDFTPDLAYGFSLPISSSSTIGSYLSLNIPIDIMPDDYDCSAELELGFENGLNLVKNVSFIVAVDDAEDYFNITDYYTFGVLTQGSIEDDDVEIINDYISDISSLSFILGTCDNALSFSPALSHDFTLPINSPVENGVLSIELPFDAVSGDYVCSVDVDIEFENGVQITKNADLEFSVENAENYFNITDYYDFGLVVQGDSKQSTSVIVNDYVASIQSLAIIAKSCEGSPDILPGLSLLGFGLPIGDSSIDDGSLLVSVDAGMVPGEYNCSADISFAFSNGLNADKSINFNLEVEEGEFYVDIVDIYYFGLVVHDSSYQVYSNITNNYIANITYLDFVFDSCDSSPGFDPVLNHNFNLPINSLDSEVSSLSMDIPLIADPEHYSCSGFANLSFDNGFQFNKPISFSFDIDDPENYVDVTDIYDFGLAVHDSTNQVSSSITNNYLYDLTYLDFVFDSCDNSPGFDPVLNNNFILPISSMVSLDRNLSVDIPLFATPGSYVCSAIVNFGFENTLNFNETVSFTFQVESPSNYVEVTDTYDFGSIVQGSYGEVSSNITNNYISDIVFLEFDFDSCQQQPSFTPILEHSFPSSIQSFDIASSSLVMNVPPDTANGSYVCYNNIEIEFANTLEVNKTVNFLFDIENTEDYVDITPYHNFGSIRKGSFKQSNSIITNNYVSAIDFLNISDSLCEADNNSFVPDLTYDIVLPVNSSTNSSDILELSISTAVPEGTFECYADFDFGFENTAQAYKQVLFDVTVYKKASTGGNGGGGNEPPVIPPIIPPEVNNTNTTVNITANVTVNISVNISVNITENMSTCRILECHEEEIFAADDCEKCGQVDTCRRCLASFFQPDCEKCGYECRECLHEEVQYTEERVTDGERCGQEEVCTECHHRKCIQLPFGINIKNCQDCGIGTFCNSCLHNETFYRKREDANCDTVNSSRYINCIFKKPFDYLEDCSMCGREVYDDVFVECEECVYGIDFTAEVIIPNCESCGSYTDCNACNKFCWNRTAVSCAYCPKNITQNTCTVRTPTKVNVTSASCDACGRDGVCNSCSYDRMVCEYKEVEQEVCEIKKEMDVAIRGSIVGKNITVEVTEGNISVADAFVAVQKKDFEIMVQGTTDEEGVYTFVLSEAGEYEFVINKAGYMPTIKEKDVKLMGETIATGDYEVIISRDPYEPSWVDEDDKDRECRSLFGSNCYFDDEAQECHCAEIICIENYSVSHECEKEVGCNENCDACKIVQNCQSDNKKDEDCYIDDGCETCTVTKFETKTDCEILEDNCDEKKVLECGTNTEYVNECHDEYSQVCEYVPFCNDHCEWWQVWCIVGCWLKEKCNWVAETICELKSVEVEDCQEVIEKDCLDSNDCSGKEIEVPYEESITDCDICDVKTKKVNCASEEICKNIDGFKKECEKCKDCEPRIVKYPCEQHVEITYPCNTEVSGSHHVVDFAVESIEFSPTNIAVGDNVEVTVTVENLIDSEAENVVVHILINDELTERQVEFAGNEKKSFTLVVSDIGEGITSIKVEIDPEEQFTDLAKYNNKKEEGMAAGSCIAVLNNENPSRNLDIVVVGTGFDNIAELQHTTQDLFNGEEGFFDEIYPFTEYQDNINIWLVTEIGTFTHENYKDQTAIFSLYCNNPDKVVLLSQDINFRSNANIEGDYAYNYIGLDYLNNNRPVTCIGGFRIANNKIDIRRMIVHEFSHSIGGLRDEYIAEEQTNERISNFPNCDDSATCTKWQSLNNIECKKECYTPNWYRPYDESLMRSHMDSSYVGEVHISQLRTKLNELTRR
ncbi:DNRLRE domain-containing protein [Nanoarchaeota archaeon]